VSGLPASVLVGLALLPFAIPVLWVIAPPLIGHTPQLSFAVPLAIAVSASILSLAVIYTIDWSPSLRLKGVFMLLGLAFFTSVSLYFLNKEMVNRVQTFFGNKRWIRFSPPNAPHRYTVMMPEKPDPDNNQPIPGITLECYKLTHTEEFNDSINTYIFVVGSELAPNRDDKNRDQASDKWFKSMIEAIVKKAEGQLDPNIVHLNGQIGRQLGPGREFVINLPDGKTVCIVHLYLIDGRIYYLSLEAEDLKKEDGVAQEFFLSFKVPIAKK